MKEMKLRKIKERLCDIYEEQKSYVPSEKLERFNELASEYSFLTMYLYAVASEDKNAIEELEKSELIQKIMKEEKISALSDTRG